MKPCPLLSCLAAVLTAGTLTSCGTTAGYKGPSLKFGIGYEGVELSVTLISKAPSPSLTEAGSAFNQLLPGNGSSGKTPAVP
jgi:hypothetical protein